jgi:hypothetical protein
MSGSQRCKHARLVGREVVKLSASVSLQVSVRVESDTTVKNKPVLTTFTRVSRRHLDVHELL